MPPRGWAAEVAPRPDAADPDHLARLTLAGRAEVSPEAMRHFQAIRLRHTDRRPVGDTSVASAAIDALRKAAGAEGVDLHLLTPDQVIELASASAAAPTPGRGTTGPPYAPSCLDPATTRRTGCAPVWRCRPSGWPPPSWVCPCPPHPPRLPAEQVIDIDAEG